MKKLEVRAAEERRRASNSSSSWKNYERVGEKEMWRKTPQCWREVTRGRSCVGTQNGCQERYRSFQQKQKCLSGSRQSNTLWKRTLSEETLGPNCIPSDCGEGAVPFNALDTIAAQGV
ncbi:hypothetical protein HPB48_026516 [Haemaphysalis longicornis]|uniref:Uncharacterized protein n=1 Tax=Haemaphysalis longicornis TaxID=44386 RepID=A0A9J6HAY9_HAELO|nr:hypothetical protein HPB48_026516 [Haemaphysalis longicornis]